MSRPHVPISTYRFQFHSKFRIEQAKGLIDYLSDLGIGDVYSSPLLAARNGSTHCYDTVDHSRLNPQITTDEEFLNFSNEIRKRDLGLVLDIVPNHIGINGDKDFTNKWWLDVMENGQASLFSHYFDIDWNRGNNLGKVLVPFFGKPIGNILEDGELQVIYEKDTGRLQFQYYSLGVPLDVGSYHHVFELALKHHSDQKIHDALALSRNIPKHTDTSAKQERADQGQKLKDALRALMENDSTRGALENAIKEFNGTKGTSSSFDRMDAVLRDQAYRLCYWKVAADEINYRRFFEINDLMAVRVEKKDVFDDAHRLVFQHIKDGRINALRIDHPDGLHDPARYFACLQKDLQEILSTGPDSKFYLLVEKILEPGEKLEKKWPIDGTTGYEFMNQLNSVFVDTQNRQEFEKLYKGVVPDGPTNFEDLLYQCKKLILNSSMESELGAVTLHLYNVAKTRRSTYDFTAKQLKRVLEELVACFPVYRTYITQVEGPSENDIVFLKKAMDEVRHRNPTMDGQLLDFVNSILTCQEEGASKEEVDSRRMLIMRLQQLTGPVMAKGLEDTAFYRYFMLASLNEVGGQPDRFGITLEDFHKENVHRATNWPHSMSASSTHDTKRSEDVRARLNVLSEIPARFFDIVKKWQQMNAHFKTEVAGLGQVPHPNEEYLIYQTLIGGWPLSQNDGKTISPADDVWKGRVTAYLTKCIKEAKQYTTWTLPNEDYEKAVTGFAEKVMADSAFLKEFLPFQKEISNYGKFNSLAQTVLKLMSPGMPDIYQGTEMYDYSLVDPDNRRVVDYDVRMKSLANIKSKIASGQATEKESGLNTLIGELVGSDDEGSLKLFTLHRLLKFRRDQTQVVQNGDYVALDVEGDFKKNIVAFSRQAEGKQIVVVVGRFFTQLGESTKLPVGDSWKNTSVKISSNSKNFRDVISGKVFSSQNGLSVKDLFGQLPFVVLESI